MPRRPPLTVWLYGTPVASLTSSGPGRVECRYRAEALDRWRLNTAVLSCSLPLVEKRLRHAAPFFRGLLPEGDALRLMAQEAGVPTFDTLGLLARFGRDVAGAAVVGVDDEPPGAGHVVPYIGDGLAEEVNGLETRPLALHDDSELSLPGLQNKMLLVRTPQGWGRPAGGYPSTHILKVEDRRFPGMAELEAGALALARAAGLTTIDAEVLTIGGVVCLIVSRYDRSSDGVRLHQEDACQALAIDFEAARGLAKYESHGGPSWADVARLLEQYSAEPPSQLVKLAQVATFTALIGNADGHGKNLSFLHPEPGVVELAPLYDTVPTVAWPTLRQDAAMRINGRRTHGEATIADLVAEAQRWNLGAAAAERAVLATAERLLAAAAEPSVPERLADLVTARVRRFLG